MTRRAPNINTLWGSLIINELTRNNIRYFCISPGSRSTPLAVAVAQNSRVQKTICYDERSAAFQALGYSRATGKPAVLISTSGTAGANYYPAVIEASVDCIPMIILTADRPPELRFTGANQTIDQVNFFGKYVRWHFDLPCPDEKILPQAVLTTIDQAIQYARGIPAGPVHVNCMFREPLAPVKESITQSYLDRIHDWNNHENPYTEYSSYRKSPDGSIVDRLADIFNQTEHGLIVVGRLKSDAEKKSVVRFVQKLNWPVFADILSGIRLGKSLSQVIHYFDQLLNSDTFISRYLPDTIVHIGGQPTSKRFLQFLEKYSFKHYIVVKDHPFRHDPAHAVTMRIESSLSLLCRALLPKIKKSVTKDRLELFKSKSCSIDALLNKRLSENQRISESAVARLVSKHISGKSGLFLASSMPVRDMNMYAAPNDSELSIGANRGASGIDGTIASAAGFAEGLGAPVTLVIGDLAFIHDLNSLSRLKSVSQSVIIILVNNHGSGIFSFLPIADFPEVFEEYFATPHEYTFQNIAAQFDIAYYNPETTGDLLTAYTAAVKGNHPAVIEVETDRSENRNIHKDLERRIIEILER